MLTGINMAFIGGDARMLEVVRCVCDLDASADLYGYERAVIELADAHKRELTAAALAAADVVVLPVAGMDDDGGVGAAFAAADIRLGEEHFAAIGNGVPVFTGIARDGLSQAAARHGFELIRLMEFDEVAILNSIPTAEGAIALAMEHTDITLHGSISVVVGMGRCGATLARVLHGLGADVRVVARKPADRARIREMGLTALDVGGLAQAVAPADIIFNTVPALILTSDVLTAVRRECVIIDIASAPGGTDFRFAEKRGIKAILAPSLPGIVAPKTAGQIIAQTLVRVVAQTFTQRG